MALARVALAVRRDDLGVAVQEDPRGSTGTGGEVRIQDGDSGLAVGRVS